MSKLSPSSVIIFTDLDGTLLDHETYSYEAAMPAIDLIKKYKIPLILSSSKTAAEIAPLRAELGFEACEAIVENGAGILEPFEEVKSNQAQYTSLRAALEFLPHSLRQYFEGFGDWDIGQVSKITGLKSADAEKSKIRQYSEPGIWTGDEESYKIFCSTLSSQGIIVQQGGRFCTLSYGGNKATRMQEIVKRNFVDHPNVYSIGLGDAKNDIDMLETANKGIIIPNKGHSGIPMLAGEKNGTIVRAEHSGPNGWSQSLIKTLEDIL